jgi:hypothetical protein
VSTSNATPDARQQGSAAEATLRVHRPLAVASALLGFLAVGALLALGTDQGGAGRSAIERFLNAVGSLGAPWLIMPLVAALGATSPPRAAVRGIAATVAALVGWYVTASLVEDLGGHGLLGDLRLELAANRVYFVAGVLSGAALGVLGLVTARRHRTAAAAGVLLILEPLYILVMGTLRDHHVTPGGDGVPVIVRVVVDVNVSAAGSVAYLLELAVGVVVLAVACTRR